jgi:hypothetical protein
MGDMPGRVRDRCVTRQHAPLLQTASTRRNYPAHSVPPGQQNSPMINDPGRSAWFREVRSAAPQQRATAGRADRRLGISNELCMASLTKQCIHIGHSIRINRTANLARCLSPASIDVPLTREKPLTG